MKTPINYFKKVLLSLSIIVALSLLSFQSNAQTGNCEVLQQACNNNGKLVVNITSGLIPPLNYTYYLNGNTIVHSNINALSDTIIDIPTCNFVYITDNADHSLSLNTGMIEPFSVDYPPTITPAACPSLGSAQLTINGGDMPQNVDWYAYNYLFGIGNLIATGNPASLPAGDYIALITDENGCKRTYDSIWITNISPIHFDVTTTAANCTNGTVTINNITGGVAPYTYQWSNGENTSLIDNLTNGYYSATVTDQQGCYSVQSNIYVNQAITINVNMTVSNATCFRK